MRIGLAVILLAAALAARGDALDVRTSQVDDLTGASRVVTNVTFDAEGAFNAISNRADALIKAVAPASGDYANVSNRAMSAIQEHQSLWPAVAASTNYTDAALGAFAETGADAGDIAEIAEYGGYGTVGAAILALIAGLAALKRRVTSAETALAQKASLSDLPYRLVEPGKWEFSGDLTGFTYLSVYYNSDEGQWFLDYVQDGSPGQSDGVPGNGSELYVTFSHSGESWHITATRASLPGHLLDRAVNVVPVTGETTLTFPALVYAAEARDFLVRLEVSGSTVPTVTFQGQGSEAPNGADELIFETDGDDFPVPDEAGTWLYAFTETKAHTFAVALKSVTAVTQGGS